MTTRRTLWFAAALTLALAPIASAATVTPRTHVPPPAPTAPAPAPATVSSPGLTQSLGMSLGIDGGGGGEIDYRLDHIAAGFPFAARFGFAYRWTDPGNALMARHVFINANDNGDPQKSGGRYDLRLDAMWLASARRGLWWYGGPRMSMFKGEYNFVGGNEFFDVTSHQYGLGLGGEWRYSMSPRTLLTLDGGLDYYMNADLSGHDTTYSPDGSAVSPVDNYGWADADAAIHQPKWAPRIAVGVSHQLGH